MKLFTVLFFIFQFLSEEDLGTYVQLPAHERDKALENYYYKTLEPSLNLKQIEKISNTKLLEIISDYYYITYFVENKEICKLYLEYFNELHRRKLSNEVDVKHMYGSLINSKLFRDANKFYNRFSEFELKKLPIFNKSSNLAEDGAGLYILQQNGSLSKDSFKYSDGFEIIVISHQKCHFCKNAAKEISNDKDVLGFFSKYSTWLTPISGDLQIEALQKWNNVYPKLNIKYVESIKNFPELKYWSTPSFYFLKNGELLGSLRGWDENRLKDLKTSISKYFDHHVKDEKTL